MLCIYIYTHVYLDYPASMSHNFKGVSTRYMVVVQNDWPPSRYAWKLDLLNFLQRNHFQICQLWKMHDVFPTSPENVHVCFGYICRVKKLTFQKHPLKFTQHVAHCNLSPPGADPKTCKKSVKSWNLAAAKVQVGIALIPWQCRNPFRYTTPKINMSPKKSVKKHAKRKFHLPTIDFHVRTASFREGISHCRCFQLVRGTQFQPDALCTRVGCLVGPLVHDQNSPNRFGMRCWSSSKGFMHRRTSGICLLKENTLRGN